ncbi:ABC transporter ATP-binding protein [Spirosoma validum]|uniref:ATP-binding cassette domain-containing protein n=1 Tax=Spirosoma validum TaxID=2771355 RepID=A0A927B0I8_9BACT|nr:ABC transporter ATP-binding protein [Spirosoma validum]MBD2753320.1 ATP-binding cassette domain-containing protein [Spirosoma validum]
MPVAIKAENISKAYQLGEIGTGTISQDLERWFARIRGKEDPFLRIGETNDRTTKGNSDIVWSLKDINFEIEQGDAVGIIGRNGAGKSTLLKILSRVTSPTTGRITGKGRIASLLEVGTGFHPELTGRENIYLNGAILGMRKREIAYKFDEIVDFAGIERYIDTPVKRYSSGMYVRLAFAVAAYLDSEILIVDEVLAVGDAEFQKKCLGKMGEVSKGEGKTVLFVSHNIAAVRKLCSKGIYLVNGEIDLSGNIENILNKYTSKFSSNTSWQGMDGNTEIVIYESIIRPITDIHHTDIEEYWATSNDYEIIVKFEIKEVIREIGIGFNICTEIGDPIVRCFFNDFNDIQTLNVGTYLCKFIIPKYNLANGKYNLIFDISLPSINKINSEKINLAFQLYSKDTKGNRYNAESVATFNSIVRPNWFEDVIAV